MRLLDRYLLRELLIPLGYCLSGFILFFCAFDMIFKLHKFQEAKMTAGDSFEYYLVTLPEVFVMLAPVALLLALLYTVTAHARYNEFTAIRAAGVSLWRLSMPYFAVGIVFSGIVFYVNEMWASQTEDKRSELLNRRLEGWHSQSSSVINNLPFHNAVENRDWNIGAYDTKTSEMQQVAITWGFPDGSHREIHAATGIYTNGGWVFRNVEEYDYKFKLDPIPQYKTNAVLALPFSETPEMIKSQIKANQIDLKHSKKLRMSMAEISEYMRLHPKLSPQEQNKMSTQWQGRFAEPLKSLMVVLIAIPFGARSGRRNVFVGVASSIVICFSYFILQQFCLSLGMNGKIPGLWAAWLPNMVFGMIGIVLILRVR